MSPYLVFIFGGCIGALIHKVIADSIAKRKRNAIFKVVLDSFTNFINTLSDETDENSIEEKEDDDIQFAISEENLKKMKDNLVHIKNTISDQDK